MIFTESDSRLFFCFVFLSSSLLLKLSVDLAKHKYAAYGKFTALICALILLIPLGMRNVGIDQSAYLEWFDNANFWMKENYHWIPEPLFALLTLFSKNFLDSFRFICVFSATIYFYGIYTFFRKNNCIGYLSLYFINIALYLYMCGIMRMSIAIGITSYAYTKLNENRKFFFLLFVATMFHYSACTMFLVFLAFRRKKNFLLKVIFCLLVLIYILYLSMYSGLLPSVFMRYESYVNFSFEIKSITVCLIMIPAYIIWFLYPKSYYKLYQENYVFYNNIIQISMLIILLAISFVGLYRLTFYFYPFIAKVYYDYSKILNKAKQNMLSVAYSLGFTIIGIMYVYRFFFNGLYIRHSIIPFSML